MSASAQGASSCVLLTTKTPRPFSSGDASASRHLLTRSTSSLVRLGPLAIQTTVPKRPWEGEPCSPARPSLPEPDAPSGYDEARRCIDPRPRSGRSCGRSCECPNVGTSGARLLISSGHPKTREAAEAASLKLLRTNRLRSSCQPANRARTPGGASPPGPGALRKEC